MIRTEIRDTLHLAIPVVLTQLGAMGMGIADTIMVGRLGPDPLSAVALGNSVSFTLLVVCMGILMALDPVVSQAYGAGRLAHCGLAMRHGAVLAVGIALPTTLVLAAAEPLLRGLRQAPPLAEAAAAYIHAINWSVLPFLWFAVLRQFMQGISRVRPAMVVVFVANAVNILANWVFIYGHLGAPAMGSTGAAWSTTVSRWFMFLVLFAWVYTRPSLRPYAITGRVWPLDRGLMARLLRIGVPVGVQYGLEVGVFASTSVLMGWIGTLALAGHQIALNLCSTTFMVPLGLSSTAAVRVGQALGRRDVAGARRAGFTAFGLGLGFMGCAALAFFLAPEFFVRIYTGDPELVAMGVSLLLVGAAFQLSDGMQTIAIGALRGAADTRFPMLVAVVSYWGVGLPLGWMLAFRLDLGPRGLWVGLTIGLTLVGTILAARFHRRVRPERLGQMQAL